jgi:hypothetical protein
MALDAERMVLKTGQPRVLVSSPQRPVQSETSSQWLFQRASLSLGDRLYFWLGRLHCSMRSPVSAAAVRSQNARPGFREGGTFRAEWHQLPAVNGSEGERKRSKADGTAALDDRNKSIIWSLQLSDFMNPPSRPSSRRHPRSNLHPKTRYVLESFQVQHCARILSVRQWLGHAGVCFMAVGYAYGKHGNMEANSVQLQ